MHFQSVENRMGMYLCFFLYFKVLQILQNPVFLSLFLHLTNFLWCTGIGTNSVI